MKKYLDFVLNVIYIFVLNIILNLIIFKDVTLLNIVFYLFEAVAFGSIFKLFSGISKNIKINRIINIILLSFITILFFSSFVHYKFYDCFFSFYSLINGGQVFDFLEAIIKIILENIYGFLLFIFLLIIMIITFVKVYIYSDKRKVISCFVLVILSSILIIFTGSICKNDIYSHYNLLYNTHNHTQNIKNFGCLTGFSIDIERFLFGFSPNVIVDSNDNYVYKDGDSDKYNVIDLDFNNDEVGLYLSKRKPSNKNEYTGIFKDKNLIFITAESFNFNIIDKDLTPTLYKLMNEGITFKNFYTPIYYASTSDGEYTNLTGNLPVDGTWSYISTKDKFIPYSYANIFDNSYKSYSYHNGMYDFYDRNLVLPNLGYSGFKGCGNGLEKYIDCSLWPQSDYEMFSSTYSDYINDDKFISYYISISMHLPHNYDTNDIAFKYKNNLRNSNYSSNVKAYISSSIDFDKGLESLLRALESKNILDDTVIVIVPDHFPYGLNKSEINEFSDINYDYDLHHSNLIIYNSDISPRVIDKYSSNIDVLPTLLNMFGIRYDSRVIIGQDIMSDSDGIVIFNNQSFLTDKGYYNSISNSFSNNKVSNEYIKNKKISVYNKVNVSNLILNNDYYKFLK